jgi:hypothetical protein
MRMEWSAEPLTRPLPSAVKRRLRMDSLWAAALSSLLPELPELPELLLAAAELLLAAAELLLLLAAAAPKECSSRVPSTRPTASTSAKGWKTKSKGAQPKVRGAGSMKAALC